MPQTACVTCGKSFYVKPNRLAKGWGSYCSNACKHKGQRTGKEVACFTCKSKVYKSAKAFQRSKSGKFFCNKSCQTIWRNSKYSGKNHPNWKNGQSSYRQAMLRSDRDKFCEKCQLKDSRVLAVHHKDQNRKNNDISNLVWLCHNCHYLVHHHPKESDGFMAIVA